MHFGFLMPVAGFWTTHPVQLAAAIIVAATAMACAAGSLYAARVWRRTPASRQGARRRLAVADTVFAVAAVLAAVSTVAQVAAWGANWGTDVRDAGADRRRAEEAACQDVLLGYQTALTAVGHAQGDAGAAFEALLAIPELPEPTRLLARLDSRGCPRSALPGVLGGWPEYRERADRVAQLAQSSAVGTLDAYLDGALDPTRTGCAAFLAGAQASDEGLSLAEAAEAVAEITGAGGRGAGMLEAALGAAGCSPAALDILADSRTGPGARR